MKIDNRRFLQTAAETLESETLQSAYASGMQRFRKGREDAYALVPDVETLRDELKQIRAATVADLRGQLESFEANARAAGAVLHWARDGQEAAGIVLEIANARQSSLVVKSKSMVTEEIELNAHLEKAEIEVVETDLGEYIVQLAGERPSHIVGPAVHKTAQQVADLFKEKLGARTDGTAQALTAVARKTLREKFLRAEIGISGVNFGVVETGSVVLVTNEGNGRMVTSLPKVHVAVMGIERLAPDWPAAAVWLSLLARSSTGQALTIYTSIITGPRRADDLDGPEEVHIILLDNGRAALTGGKYAEALECIRCAACLAVCPVYQESGGHAYHSPYSGPIGAVISPLLFGLENYPGLPQASTLCGACLEVCPVQIDLPRMLRDLRRDSVEQGIAPPVVVMAERAAGRALSTPTRMKSFFGLGRIGQVLLRLFNLKVGGLERFPLLSRRSFHELWQQTRQEGEDERA